MSKTRMCRIPTSPYRLLLPSLNNGFCKECWKSFLYQCLSTLYCPGMVEVSSLLQDLLCVCLFGGTKWEFRGYVVLSCLFQFKIWAALNAKDFISLMGRNADFSQSLKGSFSFIQWIISLIIEIWQIRFCPGLHICLTQLSSDLVWWQLQISR